jgi:hypothetical protein
MRKLSHPSIIASDAPASIRYHESSVCHLFKKAERDRSDDDSLSRSGD